MYFIMYVGGFCVKPVFRGVCGIKILYTSRNYITLNYMVVPFTPVDNA